MKYQTFTDSITRLYPQDYSYQAHEKIPNFYPQCQYHENTKHLPTVSILWKFQNSYPQYRAHEKTNTSFYIQCWAHENFKLLPADAVWSSWNYQAFTYSTVWSSWITKFVITHNMVLMELPNFDGQYRAHETIKYRTHKHTKWQGRLFLCLPCMCHSQNLWAS